MKFVLEKERELRDAVTHPTPRVDPDRPLLREGSFYETKFDVLDTVISNVIGLIRRIDTELDGKFGSVKLWIRDRDSEGRFPAETFY